MERNLRSLARTIAIASDAGKGPRKIHNSQQLRIVTNAPALYTLSYVFDLLVQLESTYLVLILIQPSSLKPLQIPFRKSCG